MKIDALHRVIDALNDSDIHLSYAVWFASPDSMGLSIFVMAAFKFMGELWVLGQKT